MYATHANISRRALTQPTRETAVHVGCTANAQYTVVLARTQSRPENGAKLSSSMGVVVYSTLYMDILCGLDCRCVEIFRCSCRYCAPPTAAVAVVIFYLLFWSMPLLLQDRSILVLCVCVCVRMRMHVLVQICVRGVDGQRARGKGPFGCGEKYNYVVGEPETGQMKNIPTCIPTSQFQTQFGGTRGDG